ncbi:unnamed protein product [Amoebophrya sp. A120]|nr:unnamed protein product [Amoebophrya sp. A120]|eukprot:GSA120T00022159001.1
MSSHFTVSHFIPPQKPTQFYTRCSSILQTRIRIKIHSESKLCSEGFRHALLGVYFYRGRLIKLKILYCAVPSLLVHGGAQQDLCLQFELLFWTSLKRKTVVLILEV